MFDGALSAQCADVVFPTEKQPGGNAAPWLPLWGSWRANSEPERAFAVESLQISAVIATGYPLSHETFSLFATAYALSVTAFSRASSPIGRAKGRALPARRGGKTVRTRRRSRPWLPLWGSWRAISEPERAFAVTSLQIGTVIATGYPLSHGTFFIFATAYALSVTAFSRDSSPIGRAKGRASPAQRRG